MLWVELCPPEKYVSILTPGTYECDLIWKEGLVGWNQVNTRSECMGWALNPMIGALIRRQVGLP